MMLDRHEDVGLLVKDPEAAVRNIVKRDDRPVATPVDAVSPLGAERAEEALQKAKFEHEAGSPTSARRKRRSKRNGESPKGIGDTRGEDRTVDRERTRQ
jgi:hypothetical protein